MPENRKRTNRHRNFLEKLPSKTQDHPLPDDMIGTRASAPKTKGAEMNATTWTAETAATGKQAQFILDLMGMHAEDDNRPEAALAIMETMTRKEASAKIDELKAAKTAAPKLTVAATVTTAAPAVSVAKGEWHVLDGSFYRVAQSQSSGKLYAKRRDMINGGFDYSPGIVGKLSTATRVNAEHIDAIKAFAADHGACMFCGLPLDTPESTVSGYGPVCATKNGLPWGA